MEVVVRPCKFGQVLIGTSFNRLSAVEFGDSVEKCYRIFINRWKNVMKSISDNDVPQHIIDKVLQAVDHGIIDTGLDLNLNGTYFQTRVWEQLRMTAPGDTISYNDIAIKIGRPKSSRAVGTACGQNPMAIFVPCHRAVRSDGSSPGFRWGLDIKQKLLDRERI